MSLDEKLKSLELQRNYSEMINELRINESAMTLWYAKLSSLMAEERPQIAGMLQSLEEISQTITTLLRKCTMFMDEHFSPVPVEIAASTTISAPTPDLSKRERDDVFSLGSLRTLAQTLPQKEIDKEKAQSVKFWYITGGGKSEALDLTFSEKDYFTNVLISVLTQIEGITDNEEFSVSPLGFNPLLLPQFESSLDQILTSYANEFTLIKFYP
ncbi:hypothetical protein CEE45_12205 [Candidatus Heimdallarchaeota archaeon B3_Heim]|nr:MAG: hypothetical protein CEE45_12205 [Candidatus Heimdallarchaeota archaeon B3_Heim]